MIKRLSVFTYQRGCPFFVDKVWAALCTNDYFEAIKVDFEKSAILARAIWPAQPKPKPITRILHLSQNATDMIVVNGQLPLTPKFKVEVIDVFDIGNLPELDKGYGMNREDALKIFGTLKGPIYGYEIV